MTVHIDDLAQQRRARTAAAEASRVVLGGPTAAPTVERVGLHYEATFPGVIAVGEQGKPDRDVHFKLDHLAEHKDEFNGELTIRYAPAGTVGGVLSWGKLNLLSIAARNSLAKQLQGKVDADWGQYIDLFCQQVVLLERTGNPTVTATEHKPRSVHDFLLEPVLPMGLPTVLYGPGGVGKSTLACGLAFSVQTGHPIIDGWKPLSGPVLILDWEGREEDWTERWAQVARGAEMDFPPFHYRACKRRLKDDAEYVAEEIAKFGIALVVVDSISLAFGTSSYADADPADMALKAFGAIREIGDITWLLIDHVTGAITETDEVATKAYGSVKKRDLARQMFHVAGAKESRDDRQELVMTHTKANYSARLRPLGLVIERRDGALKFRRTGELSAPELIDKLSMTERIRTILATGGQRTERVRELLGIDLKDKRASGNFRVALSRLLTAGEIVKLPGDSIGLGVPAEQAEMI